MVWNMLPRSLAWYFSQESIWDLIFYMDIFYNASSMATPTWEGHRDKKMVPLNSGLNHTPNHELKSNPNPDPNLTLTLTLIFVLEAQRVEVGVIWKIVVKIYGLEFGYNTPAPSYQKLCT